MSLGKDVRAPSYKDSEWLRGSQAYNWFNHFTVYFLKKEYDIKLSRCLSKVFGKYLRLILFKASVVIFVESYHSLWREVGLTLSVGPPAKLCN